MSLLEGRPDCVGSGEGGVMVAEVVFLCFRNVHAYISLCELIVVVPRVEVGGVRGGFGGAEDIAFCAGDEKRV